MASNFSKYGDHHVHFADYAIKINSQSKGERRGIVITDANIYKHNPKKFKAKKGAIPLASVTSISISPNPDTFVVVHFDAPYPDMVLNFGVTGEEKYSEFVAVLISVCESITDKKPPVNYGDSIPYNNWRSKKLTKDEKKATLTFKETTGLTSSTFKKGKQHNNVVLYPPDGGTQDLRSPRKEAKNPHKDEKEKDAKSPQKDEKEKGEKDEKDPKSPQKGEKDEKDEKSPQKGKKEKDAE